MSQLYVLPKKFAKECHDFALRFMLGPRDWIRGKNGHAYFRAELEIGLKAVTKCPQAVSLSFCFQGAAAHLADYTAKLDSLKTIGYSMSPVPFKDTQKRVELILHASPIWHSKYIHELAETLRFKDLVARAPIHTKIHKVAYYMFLDHIHPPGST